MTRKSQLLGGASGNAGAFSHFRHIKPVPAEPIDGTVTIKPRVVAPGYRIEP